MKYKYKYKYKVSNRFSSFEVVHLVLLDGYNCIKEHDRNHFQSGFYFFHQARLKLRQRSKIKVQNFLSI